MFSWFRKLERPTANEVLPLHFKDGNAALEYSTEYLDTNLTAGNILPALVVDATTAFGTTSSVRVLENGVQRVTLRVPSKEGGFIVVAETAGPNGPNLKPGDLVAWQPLQHVPEVAQVVPDSRSAWAGFVLAKLHPIYTVGRGWGVDRSFER